MAYILPLAPKSCPKGFSLIELMVAMVLGLTVVLAIATLSLDSTRSYRSMDRAGQLIENGRFAIDHLTAAVEHAGYYGTFSDLSRVNSGSQPTDPCLIPDDLTSWNNDLLYPIVGYKYMPTGCNVDSKNIIANTDILVIRRVDTTPYIWLDNLGNSGDWCLLESGKSSKSENPCGNSPTKPEKNFVYLQTTPDDLTFSIRTGDTANDFNPSLITSPPNNSNLKKPDGTPADIRRYHIDIYYLNPKASSTDKESIPSLKKIFLPKKDVSISNLQQSVVDGIENMQIQFGIDSDKDGIPDTFQSPQTLSSDILSSDVVAIRINLLARSLDADPEYTDNKAYLLNPENSLFSPQGNYRRRVFSQIVRIVNVSGRRE